MSLNPRYCYISVLTCTVHLSYILFCVIYLHQVQPVHEEIRPESPGEIELVPTDTTMEEQIVVEMSQTETELPTESKVDYRYPSVIFFCVHIVPIYPTSNKWQVCCCPLEVCPQTWPWQVDDLSYVDVFCHDLPLAGWPFVDLFSMFHAFITNMTFPVFPCPIRHNET